MSGQLTGSATGHIRAHIGADCSITIEELTTSPVAASQRSTTRRWGWAKSELNDFVWIDLAWVYAEMYYYDNGTRVYGGYDPDYECDVINYPAGWFVTDCRSWWKHRGPHFVQIRAKGWFDHHNITGRHTQEAKYVGTPGRGRYFCTQIGYVWGPTHWDCNGQKFG